MYTQNALVGSRLVLMKYFDRRSLNAIVGCLSPFTIFIHC